MNDPLRYDAWYDSPRGSWIGEREFSLLWRLLPGKGSASLLDVGCGTGYFTQHFARAGADTAGLDPDRPSLLLAREKRQVGGCVQGRAECLPFADGQFDYCMAITSLCFIDRPEHALKEMWRVARKGVLLGLLNRRSLLYLQKREHGSYQGARWDTAKDVERWTRVLSPAPSGTSVASAIFLPAGGFVARGLERLLPASFLWGGFLAVFLEKPVRN